MSQSQPADRTFSGPRRTTRTGVTGAVDAVDIPPPVIGEDVPPVVSQMLSAGRRILLVERISSKSGASARRQAVEGIFAAGESLALQRIDVMPCLHALTPDRLRLWLRTRAEEPAPTLSNQGKLLRHRLLLVDDCAPQGVVFALVAGTGAQTDELLQGPAMDWFAGLVRRYQPAVIWAREWERWAREGWSFAPLAAALRAITRDYGQPAFGSETGMDLQPMDEDFERRLFEAGARGRKEVQRSRARMVTGAAANTGPRMEHGRVTWGGNAPVPAGLAKAIVGSGGFAAADRAHGAPYDPPDHESPARRYLYVDEAPSRPDPAFVHWSHAPTRTHSSDPTAGQAVLVSWFLAHFGAPHPDGGLWDRGRCARYLVEHGYWTDGLGRAQKNRPDAAFTLSADSRWRGRVRARIVCRSILSNLSFYRTGVLTANLHGVRPRTVSGVVPHTGAWMTEEDYLRITGYLAAALRTDPTNRRVFAGQKLTVNDLPAQLQASNRGPQRYYLADCRDAGNSRRIGDRATPLPPITHAFLVRLIVEAFKKADRFPRMSRPQQQVAQGLVEEVRRTQARLAELEQDQQRTRARLDEGAFGAYRDTLNEEFNNRAPLVAQAAAELQLVEGNLEAHQRAMREPDRLGPADQDLLPLARALADPRSPTARALLRGALTLAVRTHRVTRRDHVVTVVDVSGELLVHNDDGTFVLPLHGRFEAGPRTSSSDRVGDAIRAARDGVPLRHSLGADYRRWLPEVRDALGETGQLRCSTVEDPRVLRLIMATIYPPVSIQPQRGSAPTGRVPIPASAVRRVARGLGEPSALVRRVLQVHTQPADRRRWLQDNSRVAAVAFRAAARTGRVSRAVFAPIGGGLRLLGEGPFGDEWALGSEGAVLRECAGCGGVRRVPLRVREATGSVCRSCRTDRAEVVWPPAYDRYGHQA